MRLKYVVIFLVVIVGITMGGLISAVKPDVQAAAQALNSLASGSADSLQKSIFVPSDVTTATLFLPMASSNYEPPLATVFGVQIYGG